MQSIKMIIIYYRDKKLKKILHVMKANIITIEKIDLMRLAQKMQFLQDLF